MTIEQTYEQTGHKHWLTLVDTDVKKAHRVNRQKNIDRRILTEKTR